MKRSGTQDQKSKEQIKYDYSRYPKNKTWKRTVQEHKTEQLKDDYFWFRKSRI